MPVPWWLPPQRSPSSTSAAGAWLPSLASIASPLLRAAASQVSAIRAPTPDDDDDSHDGDHDRTSSHPDDDDTTGGGNGSDDWLVVLSTSPASAFDGAAGPTTVSEPEYARRPEMQPVAGLEVAEGIVIASSTAIPRSGGAHLGLTLLVQHQHQQQHDAPPPAVVSTVVAMAGSFTSETRDEDMADLGSTPAEAGPITFFEADGDDHDLVALPSAAAAMADDSEDDALVRSGVLVPIPDWAWRMIMHDDDEDEDEYHRQQQQRRKNQHDRRHRRRSHSPAAASRRFISTSSTGSTKAARGFVGRYARPPTTLSKRGSAAAP
ncbi:hypothetical protein BC828DRAFT_381076 [Blastocladiella britannica]|nr:hypothetical protein BC828DRAFT_381076 [Blastocladiella britannica]